MRILRGAYLLMVVAGAVALAPQPAAAQLKVSIGGYIKLDAAFQDEINTAGRLRIAPGPANVVFDEGPGKDVARSEHGQFLFDAKQTRLQVAASDDFENVKLRGFVQMDFFGGSGNDDNSSTGPNSGILRLRHAKGEAEIPLGPGSLTLLFGQWWSAFQNDEMTFPDVVDFNGPAGQLFARQPQVRLTYSIPAGERQRLNLIASAEAQSVGFEATGVSSPQFNFANGSGTGGPSRQEGQNLPAFVGKIQWMSDFLQAEVAGVASRATGIGAGGNREAAFVYGLQASAKVPIGPLTIHLHADTLNGLNRLANTDYNDAVFLGRGRGVAPIDTIGGYAGLSYRLTPTTTLNGVAGIRTAEPSGHSGFGRGSNAQTDLVREKSIHVNVLHQLFGRMQVGLEYERLMVDAFRNNHGADNIYHAAFWFFF
jgi:hypothetical protein